MGILEAIIYGIIQGIAEFLPISSSGHLALAQNFFGTNSDTGYTFNIALHLATLISVCVVFRKDVAMLAKGFFSLMGKLFSGKIKNGIEPNEKLFLMLCVATLPLIPVKLLGMDDLIKDLCKYAFAIGILLIINGCMLFVCDKLPAKGTTPEKGGFWRPLGVGLVQAIMGVMPGISRSGSTISGGKILGYSKEEAVRFSFLMSIPAILGASVAEIPDALKEGIGSDMIIPMLAGAVTAAVVGFFAIKLLQYLTKNKSFSFFAVYCIIIGITAIVAYLFI